MTAQPTQMSCISVWEPLDAGKSNAYLALIHFAASLALQWYENPYLALVKYRRHYFALVQIQQALPFG